jgi:arylsulfatase
MPRDRLNVLWLMTDEQRPDSLGCYGTPWAHTPNLDRLAEQGALFRHAVTPAPVCVPARLSVMTGCYPSRTGVWYNHRHQAAQTPLTWAFAEAGYRTASFGKQDYGGPHQAFQTEERLVLSDAVHYYRYEPPHNASDYNVAQYPPAPYPWIMGGRYPEDAEHTAEAACVRQSIAWLEAVPSDTPFLLRLSFNAPHTPVVPPSPYDSLIPSDEILLPAEADGLRGDAPAWIRDDLARAAAADRLDERLVSRIRQCYYGQVAFVDSLIGRLGDWMQAHGYLENTVVVLTSDHGTHLADYGLVQKQTFYEPVVNVPLLFHHPYRVAGGRVYETPVSTLSLLPTLLDLAGLEGPARDGSSLAVALGRGDEPPAEPIHSEFTLGSFEMRPQDRLVMVREGTFKLSCCLDPQPHDLVLYDLANDPYERRNLWGQDGVVVLGERLLATLVDRAARGARPWSPDLHNTGG